MDVLASLIEKVEFCENCGEQKFVRASCWSCGSEGSGTVYQPPDGDAAGASALDAEGEEHGARLTGLWAKWRSRRTDAN